MPTDPTAALDAPRPATVAPWPAEPSELLCLLTITEELHGAPDLAAGLRQVAERLAPIVPYDTLGILLLDEVGRHLEFALAIGYRADVAEHWRFGLGQGIVGTVARSGEPLLVPDVRRDDRYIAAEEDIVCELAVPLISRGRIIGVLDLGCRRAGGLDAGQLSLLASLAGHLARAIEAARLHQSTRDQARRLSLLHEVSRELSAALDRQQLLEHLARLTRRLVDYDLFTLWLWDEDRLLLEPRLALDRSGTTLACAAPIPPGHGLTGTAAALRKAVRVANVALDPRYLPCGHGHPVRSELAVPLLFEGRLLGVLDLESLAYDAFSAADEELVSILAASLAIALENSRLYEQVRLSERRLDEDLATAREIQKRLLPRASPWARGLQIGIGYEPARHLGGDFYDVVPFGTGRVALAVGDVAGKGSPAALYGALAIGMLREYALNNHCCGADRVLSDLNHKLGELGIPNRFLALAFAIFDEGRRVLTVASSGLPYPWVLEPDGRVHRLELTGVPLGLLPQRSYQEVELSLDPGRVVVLATDGLEEAHDSEERELGSERLQRLLGGLAGSSPQEIADGLLAECRRFAGRAEPSDDRTVVVLKGA